MDTLALHPLSILFIVFNLYFAHVRFAVGLKGYGSAMVGCTLFKTMMLLIGFPIVSALLAVLLFVLYMKSFVLIRNSNLYQGWFY